MSSALIGCTGFVGKNLDLAISKNLTIEDYCDNWDYYNSKNIADIRGKTFDLVICSGAPGHKWAANRASGTDFQSILDLYCNLETCQIKRLILISTIDVFDEPEMVDESDIPTSVEPYGRNRHWLEKKLSNIFNTNIIRLPGLFGLGLKKNMIFDLLNNNRVEYINLDNIYQWYPIKYLWEDIQITINYDLPILHMATEPIPTSEIIDKFFPEFKNCLKGKYKASRYNFISKYTNCFNKFGGDYLYSKNFIIEELEQYVIETRNLQHKQLVT